MTALTPAPTAPPDAVARAAPVPVTRTAETATSQRLNAPPSSPSAAEAIWDSRLLEKLASLKRYPVQAERAGQQDTVMVRFVIDRTGAVLSADIAKSQGFALLDGEARALIQRASPLPAPPSEVAGDEIELIAPIQFILHRAP
jgi:protein TonB